MTPAPEEASETFIDTRVTAGRKVKDHFISSYV